MRLMEHPDTTTQPWRLLATAAVVGVAVDVLVLRHPIGLGATLVGVALAVGVIGVWVFGGVQVTEESRALAAALIVFSVLLSVRTSPTLVFWNLVATVLLIGLTFRLLHHDGLRSWTVARYVQHGFLTLGGWLATPVGYLSELGKRMPQSGRLAPVRRVLVGFAVAVPLLVVFAALFASADAVFAHYLSDLFSINLDLGEIVGHVVAITFFTWIAVGAARYARRPHTDLPERLTVPVLGTVEAVTVLGLLNALFLAFVLVQSAYLFGGRETLAATGLTYAEYARRGFFELAAVGALVVVVVLGLDWLLKRRSRSATALFGGLVALTLVILASAVQRMRLYTDAFGLTELRLYTSVFMGWVAFLLVWMLFTVLRERRAGFALGAFVSALAVLVGLTIANPAAIIVDTNVDHAAATGDELDVDYLLWLGSDAVPALVDRIGDVDCALRPQLAERLLGIELGGGDWRSATWSRYRAEAALVDGDAALLSAAAGVCR